MGLGNHYREHLLLQLARFDSNHRRSPVQDSMSVQSRIAYLFHLYSIRHRFRQSLLVPNSASRQSSSDLANSRSQSTKNVADSSGVPIPTKGRVIHASEWKVSTRSQRCHLRQKRATVNRLPDTNAYRAYASFRPVPWRTKTKHKRASPVGFEPNLSRMKFGASIHHQDRRFGKATGARKVTCAKNIL